MPYGGRNPYPRRYGGGKSTQQAIYESLNMALGTAFDTSDGSTVTAETSSDARAIAAVWSANARLSNQWDPRRMTDFLARWEKIFAVRPHTGDSGNARRARVIPKFLALGGDTAGTLDEIAESILGNVFIELIRISINDANINWPALGDVTMWNSTVAHLLVRVTRYDQLPGGVTQPEFFQLLHEVYVELRNYLASWAEADWGWYNTDDEDGILLDEDWNLDGEYFDAPS